jgi:glycosyltransferase involved in cell wall biosynthesis
MRILNVTETYAPFLEFGGPPVKVRSLSAGLARAGHQVTVLTADWGLQEREETEERKAATERSPFGWRRLENGVEAIYLPTWLHHRRVSWNPAVSRYCRVCLPKFEMAHIFGLYDLLGPAVAAACQKLAIPYVVEPIGMFIPLVRNFRLKRLYHRLWGRKMIAGASALVATSEQEIEELCTGGISRAKIVLRRNGVEAPASWPEPGIFRKKLGIPAQAKLVLFLGRLSAKKSPDLLLRAFAEAGRGFEAAPMRLIFAGPDEGGMKARLEQCAGQLGVATTVHFPGPLFGPEKWAAFRDADVFVLPSQNENFGNTAAESVAAGTPVIVTETCGIAPLLANEAGLVVRNDADEMAAALARILSDNKLFGHLQAGCARVTQNLGWESPVREMESLYLRCVTQEAMGEKAGESGRCS